MRNVIKFKQKLGIYSGECRASGRNADRLA